MPVDFLSQCPAEVVLFILKACDSTNDVLALTGTCRYLYNVGRGYAVERVASCTMIREIPCFEEAVTAVRPSLLLFSRAPAPITD